MTYIDQRIRAILEENELKFMQKLVLTDEMKQAYISKDIKRFKELVAGVPVTRCDACGVKMSLEEGFHTLWKGKVYIFHDGCFGPQDRIQDVLRSDDAL